MKSNQKSAPAAAVSRDAPALLASKAKIPLVDDHPITRQGMRALIDEQPDLEVCGELDNAPAALDAVVAQDPALVIIDIALKTLSGLELTKDIKARAPQVPMLVVSMHDETIYAERCVRAGATGYLMKQEASEKIVEAIRCVLRGSVFLSAGMQEKMLHRMVNKRDQQAQFAIETLSDREIEILGLIGDGFSTRQIAERLKLSSKTVDSYREHLKKKLNLNSSGDLVRYAIESARGPGR